MKPKILILSANDDSHISYVTKHLAQDEWIQIDQVDLLKKQTFDFLFKNGKITFFYKGKPLHIKSVWFRRPSPLELSSIPVKKTHKKYAFSALARHMQLLLYAFPNLLWLPHPDVSRVANNKLRQMEVASELGFQIPETLFVSSAKQAEAFVKKHGKCIVKTQAVEFPPYMLSFAKLVGKDDGLDYTSLYVDPYTFQEYIEPAYELRVTVIEDKIFVAQVGGKETDGVKSTFRDWRFSHVNDTFVAKRAQLSKEDTKRCIHYVKKLELLYGALDFIVDKKGKLWFLEINPNGQWAFVDDIFEEEIGKTIATLLQRGKLAS